MRRLRLVLVFVSGVMLIGLFAAVPVAEAAFPGDNGKIAFTRQHADGTTDVYTVNPDGTGLTQLTNAAGNDEQPAISADGTKIAFASDRTGDWKIYTMNVDGSNVTPVSDITNDFDWEPAWSPEGDQIAWTHEGGGDHGVWIRDLASGVGFELRTDAWSPDWSPDGSRLAMTSFRPGDSSAEIYTVAPNGTGVNQVTDNTRAEDSVDWSPNGSRLVFNQFDFDGSLQVNNELWLVNANGTGLNLLYDQHDAFQPTFSPDGTRVAFQQDYDIVHIPSSGGTPVTIVGGSEIDYDPDWGPIPTSSESEELIAFTSQRDGNPEIYSMDPRGGNQIRLTNNAAMDDYPAVSPDGTQIAFTSWRDGDAEIYLMGVDGSNVSQVTSNSGYDAEPTWNSDGSALMFVSDRNGPDRLWFVDLVHGVTFGPYGPGGSVTNFSPDWSAQGVVYVSDASGNNDLYSFIPEGTVTNQLTDDPMSDYGPEWSHAGTGAIHHHVLFVRGVPGDGDIWDYFVEGDSETQVTHTTELWESSPSQRWDNTYFAFARATPGDLSTAQIWAMDMEGGLHQLTAVSGGNYNPDWGPCVKDSEGYCEPLGGGANEHARTITLQLSGHLTAEGKLSSATGSPLCTVEMPVKIQKKTNGHWTTIRNTATGENQRYGKDLPDANGNFRAKAPRVVIGNDVCLKAVSDTAHH